MSMFSSHANCGLRAGYIGWNREEQEDERLFLCGSISLSQDGSGLTGEQSEAVGGCLFL